jgi:hypothetical protein
MTINITNFLSLSRQLHLQILSESCSAAVHDGLWRLHYGRVIRKRIRELAEHLHEVDKRMIDDVTFVEEKWLVFVWRSIEDNVRS